MKRRLMITGLILSLSVTFVFGADSTTMALVAAEGDRRPAAAVMNRLEAAWLQQPNVILVERQALEKILTEHQLTGAELIDAKARVRRELVLHFSRSALGA